MESKEMILSDSFEVFLKYLYGQRNFHQSAGFKSTAEWRTLILKIIDSIERSINETIENIDASHKKKLHKEFDYLKNELQQLKELNEINEKTILGLFRLIFNLIGEIPDNWELNKANSRKHWKLNNSRQIVYFQTNKQKAELFLNHASKSEDPNEDTFTFKNLYNKLYVVFNKDYQKFLEWLKIHHTEKYYEIL